MIFKLADFLQLPDEIVTYNGLVVGSIPWQNLSVYLIESSHRLHVLHLVTSRNRLKNIWLLFKTDLVRMNG